MRVYCRRFITSICYVVVILPFDFVIFCVSAFSQKTHHMIWTIAAIKGQRSGFRCVFDFLVFRLQTFSGCCMHMRGCQTYCGQTNRTMRLQEVHGTSSPSEKSASGCDLPTRCLFIHIPPHKRSRWAVHLWACAVRATSVHLGTGGGPKWGNQNKGLPQKHTSSFMLRLRYPVLFLSFFRHYAREPMKKTEIFRDNKQTSGLR